MPPLLKAVRPQEWIKNLLVFAGVVFSRQFDDGSALADAALTFAAFCAISSAGYLFNDLRDREHDRAHPDKCNRPIASGALSPMTATIAAGVLIAIGVGIGAAVKPEIGAMVAGYGVITATYSLVLKRMVIIDVMTIAALFILRVVAGAVAVDARASEYLLVVTAMLALFLGFTKRRQEAMLEQATPVESSASRPGTTGFDQGSEEAKPVLPPTRPVLEHYSLAFLDQLVAMVTAIAILSYIIYTVNSPIAGSNMLATAPSMLYGVFRYLYLIYDRQDTRSTAAILLEDPGMIFAGVTYLASAFLVLYAFS